MLTDRCRCFGRGQSIGTGPLARVEDKTFNQRRYQFFRPAGIGSIDAATEQLEKWQAYLAKAGLQYEGWTYDYPTEGEWELAARSQFPFAFGRIIVGPTLVLQAGLGQIRLPFFQLLRGSINAANASWAKELITPLIESLVLNSC